MEQKPFYIGQSLSWGWETFKANVGYLILIVLIVWLASAVFSIPSSFSGRSAPLLIFNVLSFIVGIFVSIALIKISLRFLDNGGNDFNDLVMGYPYFLNMLVGSILYGLLVLAGFILLIVPGIYWALKYQFYGFLIVDQNMQPVDAIKRSGHMTQGSKWHLLGFWLAAFGVNLLGAIACGIGLFVTFPLTYLAHAHIYRSLAYAAQFTQPAVQPPPVQTAPPVTGP